MISLEVMADGKGSEAKIEDRGEHLKPKDLHHGIEDDLGDEDLFNFLDFPEEVANAIAEVTVKFWFYDFLKVGITEGVEFLALYEIPFADSEWNRLVSKADLLPFTKF